MVRRLLCITGDMAGGRKKERKAQALETTYPGFFPIPGFEQ